MSRVGPKASGILFLLLVILVQFAGRVSAAEMPVAGLGASQPLYAAPAVAKPHLTPLPRLAQGRCPGGQLVFLSRACGCNGACCLCSRQAPYLNHCTCRCEANPSPCARGHSAGNP